MQTNLLQQGNEATQAILRHLSWCELPKNVSVNESGVIKVVIDSRLRIERVIDLNTDVEALAEEISDEVHRNLLHLIAN